MRGTFLRFHEIGRCKYKPGDFADVDDWRAPGLIAAGIFDPLVDPPPVIRAPDPVPEPVPAAESAPDKALHPERTVRKGRFSRRKKE